MRNLKIFFSLSPWIVFIFFIDYNDSNTALISSIATLITLILSYNELKRLFILPVSSLIFFSILWLNALYIHLPWISTYFLIIGSLALPTIILISILSGNPFTIQYAKMLVDQSYWKNPMFLKINYILSSMWCFMVVLINLPGIILSKENFLDHLTLNYVYVMILLAIAVYINHRLPKIIIGRNFWANIKRLPKVKSPFLLDNFSPIKDELNLNNLEVIGAIPKKLNGRYLRNGPNPYFTPYTYTYPIDGDGMIHQITLKDGIASYKNRFVATTGYLAERKAKKALYGGIALPIPPDPRYVVDNPSKNTASINVISWQNKLLALYEASEAYVLDNDLRTIGKFAPNPNFLVNAHSCLDYNTYQTYMCSYNTNHPNIFLTLYEFDYAQNLVKELTIKKPNPTMIHDFVITKNYVIFFDPPAIFNVFGKNGDKPFFYYDKDIKSRIILVNRKTYEIKNIENIDSFFVYHFVNAYEQDNKILVDFVHHESLNLDITNNNLSSPNLYHGEIDLESMTYSHHVLSPVSVEFPSFNDKLRAQPYRYIYTLAKKPNSNPGVFNQLLKYDLHKHKAQTFDIMPNAEFSEFTFIAKDDSTDEDDGYLVGFVYHKDLNTSSFIILDSKHPDKIIAQIKLPTRVPHGLHGNWISEK